MSQKSSVKKVKAKERATPAYLFGQMIQILREHRESIAKLPIEELAKKASISVELWNKIEAGSSTFEELTKAIPHVAFALRVNPRTLTSVFFHLVLD